MIKVKDGYAKNIGTTYSGSAARLLLSNGGDKAVSDFAASSHKHSASDITSGTLSVARGGTGATSFTSGAALIGNGTGAVSTRSITSSATKDSTSLITSGGVYSALAGKMNAYINNIELNTSGSLKSYGGFIDFHFHNSDGTPLNASGEVTSDGKTPDYTSRIIEDAAGTISVNGVKFKGNKVTASGGFVGNLTGNVTGNVSGSSGSCTGNAASATNADKLDNIDSTGFMQVISQNATWSSVENIPTNLTPGVHAVHISGKEYSSILAGNDYTGAQWQLYFHPHASYLGSIKYRYSGDNVWKTLLDSSNSSVSKNGQTLTVKINGSEQSLTNSTYNFSGVSFTSGNQNTGEHNCNNIKSNGVWYYTSNGPTTTLGATTNDGALYSQAYSTSWVAQIAQDYRNGNLFTRGLNSGSWSSWRKVAYVDDTVRNAYYMRTMESGNSNWYTGWKAWFKWIDGSTLGLKITNANTDDNTDASSYKFKADLAGVADSATTATNLSNKPSLLISGNTIAVKAGEKTSDYITVPYATKAYIVSSYEVASSSNTKRRIWIDWTSKDGKAAYSDDLTYQTDIKTLFAPYLYGKITVPGGSYSWYQVQQYNSSDANPSYYDATCAIVNINSYTGWQPWIRGVDSENGSWTIGQYTTNLHIGYIPKSNTTNGLTYKWDFGKDGSTIFPGSIKFNKILIPTSSGGTTYGAGTSGQVLKSNGTTVYWASDSNSNTWRAIQVNGTQIAGTGTGTYAVNFKSGTGISVLGTAGSSSAANAVTITNTGVRATTINGNYLRVNTNGKNADLTIPYATLAGKLQASSNTITTTANDTTAKWGALHNTVHFYSTTGQLTDQPSQYGLVVNFNNSGSEVHQLWLTQASGDAYHRGGNSGGWSGTWRKFLDSSNYTSYVNTTNFPGLNKTGTVTSVATGTGLTGGTITGSGTISINSTYQTYISNGNTAYGWGNHANAGYIKSTSILKGWSDTRSAATKPNDYNGAFKVIGIKSAGTTLGLTSTQAGDYATIIGWRGWSDSSGGYAWEIASTDKNRLYVRSGSTTSWNNGWQAIAYTSDIPTKTSQLTNDSGYLTSLPSHNHDGRYAWGNYASQSELSDCNNVSSTGFWTHSGFTNRPTDVKDWGSLMNIRLYNSNNNYHRQLFFDCYGSDYVWTRSDVGGTWTSWKRLALASEIPSVGNGTVTINQAGASKGSFTLNQSTAATINLTDTNYYHTPSYSSGLSIASGTGVNAMYVPNAGASQSGVVSTGAQTFAGEKTFSSIRLRSTSTTNYGGYLYFGDGSFSYITEPTDDTMSIYASKGITIHTGNATNGNIYLKSALSNLTSASTSYPGVVCDGMYLKSALYHIGSVYKLQSSTSISVSYGYGISGVTISSSKPREGKCTITVTNKSGFSIYVHTPHLVSLFTDAGEGSCYEHGFAYIQTGVTFPKSVSSGSTLSFSVIYGYMHTQRTWNTNDFTKSNDGGGFNCGVYVSRYV